MPALTCSTCGFSGEPHLWWQSHNLLRAECPKYRHYIKYVEHIPAWLAVAPLRPPPGQKPSPVAPGQAQLGLFA